MTTHEAGRELDALIAEKIFGYTLDYEFADMHIPPAPAVKELRDGMDEWGILPFYSTEIGDAWLVVELMHTRGFWCQIRTPFEGHDTADCWAGFTPHSTSGWNGRPDHWTQADTVPHAICLAALRCIGVIE
jgi:hypothetical protein